MISWQVCDTTYELEPNDSPGYARIVIKNPRDKYERDCFIPRKLLDLYVGIRMHGLVEKLLEIK